MVDSKVEAAFNLTPVKAVQASRMMIVEQSLTKRDSLRRPDDNILLCHIDVANGK